MARLHEWTSAGRGGAAALLDTHRPGAFAMEAFAPARPWRPTAAAAAPGPRLALRAYRPPLAAHVVVRDGAPVFVSAGAAVRGPVVDRAGPWRASGDWWDVPWSREEWDIALAGGALFRHLQRPAARRLVRGRRAGLKRHGDRRHTRAARRCYSLGALP